MTFRARLVIASTAAVAIAVLLACSTAWVVARNSLVSSVDDTLIQTASSMLNRGSIEGADANGAVTQVSTADGRIWANSQNVTLPVEGVVRAVSAGKRGATYVTVTANHVVFRELIVPLPAGQILGSQVQREQIQIPTSSALQLAVPLVGVNRQLRHLEVALLFIAALGVLIAVLLGFMVARTAIRPLDQVTEEIEEIADTTDLSRRLDEGGPDELGRLRRTFNRMLGALSYSQDQQRQLVLDASHELRTPLTSLRTNTEVLRRVDELDPETRTQLLDDVLSQLTELTTLVGDLTELARGERHVEPSQRFRLDQLVDDLVAVASTHGRTRGLEIDADLKECWVIAHRERVSRAIGNLLNNAIKWSPEEGTIEVTVDAGAVIVRDHGPGIAPEDLPKVFNRFYRAPSARSMPGSGLGLAIVAQVATEEGGTVSASQAPGGGALLRFEIPAVQ